MTIRVSLAGVTGWTGKLVAESVIAAPDMELVSCVSRSAQGKTLSSLGLASDLVVSGSVAEALKTRSDVFVDFTSADAVKEHVLYAIGQGVSTIVGSSGLSATDFDEIQTLALDKGVGVIACGNFSITAALAKHFSLLAAKYLPSWEIIDYASATKIDAPSGTVRELAECMEEVRQNKLARPVSETVGEVTARGAQIKGTPVHSVRLPGYVIAFETVFGLPDERLTLRHDAGTSARPYVDGTLLAIRQCAQVKGLVRGLDKLLF
ncbi:MAG: 4-hydroxy-tetrahydrodipicolinate reductase [Candidatus Obscuribacter sp.]|nr:4-hydroxy-tetrahydrodipicolinate reductase [Candidatus Obscuribacter sp.]